MFVYVCVWEEDVESRLTLQDTRKLMLELLYDKIG